MCRKFPFITLALNFLCFFGETLHASMPKKVVEIEMIKFQTIREVVRLFGTVKAKRQSAIISRIDGILEDALDSGSLVKKGQIVVRLSNKPSRAALETARQTEALEAEKYQRAKDLHHRKIISKAALETAHKNFLTAKKATADAEKNIEDSEYPAPFDGIVGVYKVKKGTHLSSGDEIVTIYDPTRLLVSFDVPEDLVSRIKPGQKLILDERYEATLSFLQKLIDPETHMAPAEAEIDETSFVLGGNIDVDVVLEEKKNALTIPFEAYFLRDGKSHVYKLIEGKVKLTPIQLGIQEKDRLEVTEGLQPGDQVISVNPTRLYPELDVEVADNKGKNEDERS